MLMSESGIAAGAGGASAAPNWRLPGMEPGSLLASHVNSPHARTIKKLFADASSYEGSWDHGMPDGHGTYVWSDGSSYTGTWMRGHRHGVGSYQWASGASYMGEWRENHMHGVGTLEGAHTAHTPMEGMPKRHVARYQGGWNKGVKCGLGKQLFANGDVYEGVWKAGVPHGPGRYRFAVGGEYDGAWQNGLMHGTGTFVWASGERYDGQWKMGLPDGLGVLTLKDGSIYDSQWHEGLRHGVCLFRPALQPSSKSTARRSIDMWQDVKGSFKEPPMSGLLARRSLLDSNHAVARDQSGRYNSAGVNTARGDATGPPSASAWSSMLSFGARSFSAATRRANANANSSSHGPGSPRGVLEVDTAPGSLTVGAPDASPTSLFAPSPVSPSGAPPAALAQASHSGNHAQPLSPGQVAVPPSPLLHGAFEAGMPGVSSFNSTTGGWGAAPYAFVREYDAGQVLREWPLGRDEAESVLAAFSNAKIESSIGKLLRRSTTSTSLSEKRLLGEALSKGHRSYDIMLALQLGIRFSVSTAAAEELPRELQPSSYTHKVKQWFPRQGTDMTPVHSSEDFTWIDYAPRAFRKLRELFDVQTGSYLDSLCSDAALRLLNSPGKSGSVFFLTHDDQFFVKTIKKGEAALLYNMLPQYHRHMAVHPHTLLTKFYGLHAIKTANNRKVYLVVMGNLFNMPVQLNVKYDLKGSSLGRTAGVTPEQDPHAILKDLDLKTTFKLEPSWLERLEFQLRSDCALLQACSIMDYSLLLGVSYAPRGNGEVEAQQQQQQQQQQKPPQPPPKRVPRPSNFSEAAPEDEYNVEFPRLCERLARSKLPDEARERLVALARARLVEGPGAKAAARRSQAVEQGAPHGDPAGAHSTENMTDHMALQMGLSHTQLGVNMPAVESSGQECVVFFGIIDILQDYNHSKRLEHGIKSLVHDSKTISVTDPQSYAQRFITFIRSVFA